MDGLLYARYRRGGGDRAFVPWEFSSGLSSWENAPAPAQVGRRFAERLSGSPVPPEDAAVINNVTHWAYGIAGGAQYGIVAGSLRAPRVGYGLPFGALIWSAGYVVLPVMGIYEPIWKYDRMTLARDLSAHLVYGLATATTWWLLTRQGSS